MFRHPETPRQLLSRYGRTFSVVAVAVVLRGLLEPVMENAGFSIFLIAILVGAWVGGVGPSLLGQTVLLRVHGIFFATATSQPWQPTVRGVVNMSAFYLVGTVVAVLSEARQAALRRAAAQNEKIAQQQEELQATIAGIGDGVIVTDQAGRVCFMNPVAESLTGWCTLEAQGESYETVFRLGTGGAENSDQRPLQSVLDYGKNVREGRVLVLHGRHGEQVSVTYNATPIRNPAGEVAGAVIIVRDETDRQRAEEQLREMNRRKDDFLATLAHELRNPLTPIRTGLQLLKLSSGDPNVATEVREIMERQTQHMVRLIDDLLDVSRITRGKLELRKSPINFARVVGNALDAMRPLIDGAGHELIVQLPTEALQIEADADRLTQITCNLIHNAIKFTPPGGRIEVKVEQGEEEVRLTVSDNGRGISPEHLASIFEMFNQGAEEKERGHSGLGIGLTLARRLVELHGGSIDAHSAGDNRGSTFRVRLPIGQRFSLVEPSRPQGTQTDGDVRRRRVLLVDDNEDGLRTIELMMRSLGHETRLARDGLEALDVAEEFRPEVVLMDLGMPRLNGYEAAQRLRQQPWGQELLLIAVSGWGQEKDRQRTRAAGFDDHFVKPVDIESLRACLERHRSACAVPEFAAANSDPQSN